MASPDDKGGKAAGGKDDVEEAGEYAERQARMRRLSNKRGGANEAESRLWAEREALGRLAAKRDAREYRLRSAEEMAVCEGSGMRWGQQHLSLSCTSCGTSWLSIPRPPPRRCH